MSNKKHELHEVETPNQIMGLDFSEDAGNGFENVTSNDVAIPFLKIAQKMSDEVDKTKPDFIQGCEAGDIFNSVTKEVYKNGISVVLCNFRKEEIEWKTREKGGGLVTIHSGDTPLVNETTQDEKGRKILPNGNQLSTVCNHYVMYKAVDGEFYPAIISMGGTQLKNSKKWLGLAAALKINGKNGKFTPPMFSSLWNLTTVSESNDQGSWSSWKVEREDYVDNADLYIIAKGFHKNIQDSPRIASSTQEVKQLAAATHDEAI